ncbi:MAG: Ig-like domain-containing protein [Anaeromyxobacter sp.]
MHVRSSTGRFLALALLAVLSACGGSDEQDTTPPTVQFATEPAAAVGSDAFTLHITFSEPLKLALTSADVTVDGATLTSFRAVSNRAWALKLDPPRGTAGQINVSIAAGAVEDAAGNLVAAAEYTIDYDAQNLIRDGGFDAGSAHWDTWANPQTTAALQVSVSDGHLDVAPQTLGNNPTDLQVKYMSGIPLESGETYTVSFVAWADEARVIQASLWENGNNTNGDGTPWGTYLFFTDVALTTVPTPFSAQVTMQYDNASAGFCFFVGDDLAGVHFDDMVVTPQ